MNEEGRWVTISGRRVFIRTNQHPLDAFIRQQKKVNYEDGKLEEERTRYVIDENKKELVKKTTPTKYQLNDGRPIEFIDNKRYKKEINDFYENLTKDEKETLYSYMSSSGWFYSKFDMGMNEDLKGYNKRMNTMKELFDKKAYTTKEDTLVFRRGFENVDEIKNGFVKERMVSTSAYDKLPKTMPSGKPFGDKEYYIILPKGIKYLPIEKVGTDYVAEDKGEKMMFARQHELLIEPNLEFKMIQDKSKYKFWADEKDQYKYVLVANKRK